MRFRNAIGRYKKPSGAPVAPAPTPSPTFNTQPSITGTPTVGNALSSLTFNDPSVSNGTITTRTYLLGGVSKALSYVLVTGDIGALVTFKVDVSGPGGTNSATSTGVAVVAAVSTPSDPVTSNISSGWTAGDNPPNWDTTYSGIYYDPSDFTGDGLRIRYKFAGAGSYTTLPWTPFDINYLSDGFTYAFLTDGTLNAGGAFEVQVQAGRNFSAAIDGVSTLATPTSTSNWSNSWTDTLNSAAEAATTLNPTTGTDKSQYTTVDTGNLRGTGQSGFNGAPISIRALNGRTGKRQFQATISNYSGQPLWIGIDTGSTDFNTGFVRPGKDNTNGIGIRITTTDWAIFSTGGTAVQSGDNSSGVFNGIGCSASGDVLTVTYDSVTGTVSFYNTRSGTTRQYGTAQAKSLATWKANIGFESSDSLTAKFGTGQTRTLDSGYVPYDN